MFVAVVVVVVVIVVVVVVFVAVVVVAVAVAVVVVRDWGGERSLELPAIGKCSARGVCVWARERM